ncbi:hypothetical protein C7S15_6683 [Burkholderia cepacia]|nr:hypothetical protein [Burkholderia cepacia]
MVAWRGAGRRALTPAGMHERRGGRFPTKRPLHAFVRAGM